MVSLYLDLDPAEFPTPRSRRLAITALLDAAHSADRRPRDRPSQQAIAARRSRARAGIPRGVAAQEGSRRRPLLGLTAGFFETVPLPRPTRTRAFIGDSPYVTPLVAAADVRDWLIVLVDARARMLHGNTDHVEEFERVEDRIGIHREAGGPDGYRRGWRCRSTATSNVSPGRPRRTCARRASGRSSSAGQRRWLCASIGAGPRCPRARRGSLRARRG